MTNLQFSAGGTQTHTITIVQRGLDTCRPRVVIPSNTRSRTVLTLPNPLFDLLHTPNMTTNKIYNHDVVYDVCFFDFDCYYFFFFLVSLFFLLLYSIYLSVHSRYQKRCQCNYGNSNELAPSLAQPWFVTSYTHYHNTTSLGYLFWKIQKPYFESFALSPFQMLIYLPSSSCRPRRIPCSPSPIPSTLWR